MEAARPLGDCLSLTISPGGQSINAPHWPMTEGPPVSMIYVFAIAFPVQDNCMQGWRAKTTNSPASQLVGLQLTNNRLRAERGAPSLLAR